MTSFQAFGDNLISQKYPNTMKISIQSSPDQLNLIPPQDRQIRLKFFDTNTTNPVRDVTFVIYVTKGNQTFLQSTFWTQSGSFTLNLQPGKSNLWIPNPDHDPIDGLYYSKGDQIDIWTPYLTEDVYHFSIQPVVIDQNNLRQQNVGGKFTTDLNLLSTYNETLAPNANIVSSVNPLEIPSPLKQFKSGVTTQNIVCKDGFVLAIKKHGHQPACVNPDIIPKLVLRGWSENPLDSLLLKYGNQTQANLVFYDIMNEQKIRDWAMKGWMYSDYSYTSNGEIQQSFATIHLYLPSNMGQHECENGSYGIVVINLKPVEIEHNYTDVGCNIVTTTSNVDPESNG